MATTTATGRSDPLRARHAKNRHFEEQLGRHEVELFDDAVTLIREGRGLGLGIAMALRAAGAHVCRSSLLATEIVKNERLAATMQPLRPQTINSHLHLLSEIRARAVREGVLARKPAEGEDLRLEVRREKKSGLELDEAMSLVEAENCP